MLVRLPNTLYQLVSLIELHVDDNKLTDLPLLPANLNKLSALFNKFPQTYGNTSVYGHMSVILESPEAIQQFNNKIHPNHPLNIYNVKSAEPFKTNITNVTDCANNEDIDPITLDNINQTTVDSGTLVKLSDGKCYDYESIKQWAKQKYPSSTFPASMIEFKPNDYLLLGLYHPSNESGDQHGGKRRRRRRSKRRTHKRQPRKCRRRTHKN